MGQSYITVSSLFYHIHYGVCEGILIDMDCWSCVRVTIWEFRRFACTFFSLMVGWTQVCLTGRAFPLCLNLYLSCTYDVELRVYKVGFVYSFSTCYKILSDIDNAVSNVYGLELEEMRIRFTSISFSSLCAHSSNFTWKHLLGFHEIS